jgi:hypothetical protein
MARDCRAKVAHERWVSPEFSIKRPWACRRTAGKSLVFAADGNPPKRRHRLAGELGFEPRFSESELAVLVPILIEIAGDFLALGTA